MTKDSDNQGLVNVVHQLLNVGRTLLSDGQRLLKDRKTYSIALSNELVARFTQHTWSQQVWMVTHVGSNPLIRVLV